MKKIVLSLIILIIVCSSAFALSEEVSPNTNRDVYGALVSPYKSLDARSLAMGGVGIAGLDNYQSFWSNPAGLADNKVQVSTPNVGVSLYNPVALYKAYKSGLFEKIANGEINENNISEIYNDENVNKDCRYKLEYFFLFWGLWFWFCCARLDSYIFKWANCFDKYHQPITSRDEGRLWLEVQFHGQVLS